MDTLAPLRQDTSMPVCPWSIPLGNPRPREMLSRDGALQNLRSRRVQRPFRNRMGSNLLAKILLMIAVWGRSEPRVEGARTQHVCEMRNAVRWTEKHRLGRRIWRPSISLDPFIHLGHVREDFWEGLEGYDTCEKARTDSEVSQRVLGKEFNKRWLL